MTNTPPHVQVFIGSSSEGLKIARTLQVELESATGCTVNRWNVGTFAPGSFTLDALLQEANTVDFAILVATGEDTITTRGAQTAAVRDNIILEFGLFLGALGRERVYLLSVDDAKLPSDLLGLTRLIYRERPDGNIRAGLTDAVLSAENAIETLGPLTRETGKQQLIDTDSIVATVAKDTLAKSSSGKTVATQPLLQETRTVPARAPRSRAFSPLEEEHKEQTLKALEEEIQWLCSNATEQGWSVIKQNPTMLRLRSPKGPEFTLTRRRPTGTRADLRKFVAELRANGLRVNGALQGAVRESPFG